MTRNQSPAVVPAASLKRADVLASEENLSDLFDAVVVASKGHAAAIRTLIDDGIATGQNVHSAMFGRYRGQHWIGGSKLQSDPRAVAYLYAGQRFTLVEYASGKWKSIDLSDIRTFDQNGNARIAFRAKEWMTERTDFITVERYALMRASARIAKAMDDAETTFTDATRTVKAADYDAAVSKADAYAAKLRAAGIDPDA